MGQDAYQEIFMDRENLLSEFNKLKSTTILMFMLKLMQWSCPHWHCLHSMLCRFYIIMVRYPYICLSQYGPTALTAAGLLLWAQHAGDIDQLLPSTQQRAGVGSAALSAYVGSWTQTCNTCLCVYSFFVDRTLSAFVLGIVVFLYNYTKVREVQFRGSVHIWTLLQQHFVSAYYQLLNISNRNRIDSSERLWLRNLQSVPLIYCFIDSVMLTNLYNSAFGRVGGVLWRVCLFVRLCVRLSANTSPELCVWSSLIFLCMLFMAVALVALWYVTYFWFHG